MNMLQAVEMLRQLITTSLMVAGPILITGMVTGIGISLFQSVTSIQEPTLGFVPKLLSLGLVMVITAPWVLRSLMEFTISYLSRLPEMVG